MSSKNAIAANEGTSGNLGGDTYAQSADLAQAFQSALAENGSGTWADGARQDSDLDQDSSVEQADNNNVSMNITF